MDHNWAILRKTICIPPEVIATRTERKQTEGRGGWADTSLVSSDDVCIRCTGKRTS